MSTNRFIYYKPHLWMWLFSFLSACDEDIQVRLPTLDYTISEEVPRAYKPGERVTIRGSGFTVNHRVVINGVFYPTELISREEMRFTMPQDVGNGKVQIATKLRSLEKPLPNIFALTANDFPLYTGDSSDICSDKKFYDASGELKTGSKDCTQVAVTGLTACSVDGEVGCETNASFKAALVIGAENKIVWGQTLAGIPGNITLPAVGKVLTGTGFGVGGTGSSGTLILPLGTNVKTGSGTYGDPGAAIAPSYSPDFPSAANVLNSDTVDNLAGTLKLPAPAYVRTLAGNFGVGGSGSVPTLADCTDGASGCFVVGPNMRAAATSANTGDKILFGQSVAGIGGNVILPAAGKVLTGTSFGVSGTGSSGALILPLATNVKSGSDTYGDPGSAITPTYSPDFPALANVRASATVNGQAGTLADCSTANQSSCVATTNFKTMNLTAAGADAGLTTANFNSRIINAENFEFWDAAGQRHSVAGDTDLALANVKSGVTIFGVTGGLAAAPTNCSSDGQANCLVNGESFAAGAITGAASKILSGQTLAGVSGNVTLPAAGKVLTGAAYGVAGTGSTGTLTLPAAGNVLSTNGNYGDAGALITPTLTLPAAGKVLSGTNYGALGTGLTGALTLPTAGNVLAGSGTYGDTAALTTPTLTLPAVGKVLTSTTYGVAGTGSMGSLTLPAEGAVRSSAGAYGDPGSAVSGTIADCAANGSACYVPAYVLTNQPLKAISHDAIDAGKASIRASLTLSGIAGTLADCSANAATGCVTTGSYQSADLTNLAAGNIKRGISLAGITGNFPSATSPTPRYTDSGATTAIAGTDITDLTNFVTQLTTDGAFEYWDSMGIRRTGSGDTDITASNVKNAVAFENLTLTGTSTGAEACTGDGQIGCTTTSRYQSADTIWPQVLLNTVYKDHITGLVWLRDQGSTFDWYLAMSRCADSTEGSRSDWRLPTWNELETAFANGVWASRRTNLSLTDALYWSSTSGTSDNYAFSINPNNGNYASHVVAFKPSALRVICVAP